MVNNVMEYVRGKNIIGVDRITYFKAPKVRELKGHRSKDGYEKIEVITGGRVWFNEYEDGFYLSKGAVIWHGKNEKTVHLPDVNDPYECLVIQLNVEPSSVPRTAVPRISYWQDMLDFNHFCWDVMARFQQGKFDSYMMGQYVYHSILWKTKEVMKKGGGIPFALKKALVYMDRNLGKDLDLALIAEKSEVSVSYLHKLFKQHMHRSPLQYLIESRIFYAKDLLTVSSLPIKQVCESCGYVDVANFSRLFKKTTGETPGEYREKRSVLKDGIRI